jgi:predicted aspartyl protease
VIHLLLAALLTPVQVLAKARAAAGMQAAGTYHIEERETYADATVTFDRIVQGRNYIETMHDGQFTTAEGYVDGIVWTQNANGIVLVRNRAPVTRDPYLMALSIPSANPSTLQAGNDASGDVVLDITPRAGVTERRVYDPSTFLVRSVTYDNPNRKGTYVYSAYKRFFGAMIPSHVEYTSPYPQNNWTADVVSYVQVPDSSVHFAVPASRPVFDVGANATLPLPVDFTRQGIVVRVTVAGRGLDFLLDSGASESVIDEAVANELGLTVTEQRAYDFLGKVTRGKTMIDDLALGPIHAHHFALDTIPLSINTGDQKIVGLLGGDFFASARIAVDFGKKTVTMLGPSTALPTDGWTQLPIQVTDFVPVTKAKLNGVDGTFIVDLGSFDNILFTHYFANFTPNTRGDVQGKVIGVSGVTHDYRSYTFSRIDIGDLAFADMRASVIDGGRDVDTVNIDGLIGRTFWGDFAMIFDYANQTLYVKPEL